MPKIMPISDLRNNFNEISDICHRDEEPVYITKNGRGDLVVTSIEYFEQLQAKIELYNKLAVAEVEIANGAELKEHKQFMNELRERYSGK